MLGGCAACACRSYHRFFSRARWTTDEVGLTLAALLIERLAPKGGIRLVVDDTPGRHTGKLISGASISIGTHPPWPDYYLVRPTGPTHPRRPASPRKMASRD
jgi:hypothetical protein